MLVALTIDNEVCTSGSNHFYGAVLLRVNFLGRIRVEPSMVGREIAVYTCMSLPITRLSRLKPAPEEPLLGISHPYFSHIWYLALHDFAKN